MPETTSSRTMSTVTFLDNPLLAELFGALVFALLLLHLVRVSSGRGVWQPVPALLPLALWALLPLLQSVPLPPAIIHWLSPRAWELYRQSVWVVAPQAWMPLSLDLPATLQVFFRGVTAWGLYLLVVQALAGGRHLERSVLALTGLAALSAVAAFYLPAYRYALLPPAVLLPLTLALYLAKRPRVVYYSWRERLTQWLCRPRLSRQPLLLGAALLMAAALLGAAGRAPGGWSVGLLVFALLLLTRRRLRRWGGSLALLAVFLVAATLLPLGGNRFGSVSAWLEAWQILADFPLMGIGGGAQTPWLPPSAEGQKPLWLAAGVGVGIGGMLLVLWAMFGWLRATLPLWRGRRNVLAVCLYAGGLGGLSAALLSGGAPLEMAAVPAGLAAAAALHSSRPEGPLTPTGRLQAGLAMALFAVLLAGQSVLPLLLSERLGGNFGRHSLAVFAPERAQALIDERLRGDDYPGALRHVARALRLRPFDPSLQLQAAEIYDRLGEEERADRLWLSAAEATPDGARRYAQRLWQRGEGEAAKAYLRRTLTVHPRRTGEFLPLLEFWGLGHREMAAILPEEPAAQLALGEFLASRAETTLAAQRFRRAVLLAGGGGGEADIFERAGEFFFGQGLHADALEMVQSGLRHFPARLPLRRMAGSIYEQLGIRYRAIEEYRQCLVIDPSDQWSRQRLAVLMED